MASALVAAVVVSMVGFARVYRGLHHPTDVLFGALLGLACLAVAAMAVRAAWRGQNKAASDSDEVRDSSRPGTATVRTSA